jgi:tRNA1Val (adenine37-N6)-methyltransferase
MKINTDGVLLGALANVLGAKSILDIGTGTGVIALMLAQRNHQAQIDAIDIDSTACSKATQNFDNSLFHDRLKAYHHGFKVFFELYPAKKYNLIVSNPPFFLNALQSPKASNNLSKHTDEQFFIDLLRVAQHHLHANGHLELIVPVDISLMLQKLAPDFQLHAFHCIKIKSYEDKAHIRHILSFSRTQMQDINFLEFCIFADKGIHSLAYKATLKDFFTIF